MNNVAIVCIVFFSLGIIVPLLLLFFDFYSSAKSSKFTSIVRRSYMGATRLYLEILSHTVKFSNRFRMRSFTDEYLNFEYLSKSEYWSVSIIKTSAHCFRVIVYCSFMSVQRIAEYRSFRTIADMCVYLDSICPATIENK